ncbi:MAG: STAS domain-containing protein [Chloroherpetonaceae bacterium]|nr:STAS domain-containing protein [Chloroherpetonaceae bacterium]
MFSTLVRELGKTSAIDLIGELDAHTSVQLERTIQEQIEKKRVHIIINCAKLSYISSAGLGVFMAFIDDVRAEGGDIKFSNMSDKIFQVFDLLGFPLLYEIFKEEQEAVEKFNAPTP